MGLLSQLFSPSPETVEQLDQACRADFIAGDYQKAARTAQKFRNYASSARHFDEAEKYKRGAIAYYWICCSAFEQASRCKSNIYEILVAFFASHKMAYGCFQKIIFKALTADKNHSLYPRFQQLNDMYDAIYSQYETSTVEKADLEANQQIKFS